MFLRIFFSRYIFNFTINFWRWKNENEDESLCYFSSFKEFVGLPRRVIEIFIDKNIRDKESVFLSKAANNWGFFRKKFHGSWEKVVGIPGGVMRKNFHEISGVMNMFRWDIINLQSPPNTHGIEPIAFIGD